jgi:DNA polymerase
VPTPSRPGDTADRRKGAPLAPPPETAAAARPDLLGDSPPADLAAFRQWWMETPGLAPSPAYVRVPPRGAAGARLMVLVPQPEAEDGERLLSGPQGRLLAAILAAMGMSEGEVYIAAALPCHTPLADLPALAMGGWDAVTARHIALVRPKRLVAFGTGLAAMLGTEAGAGLERPGDRALREINQTACKTPVIISETLDAMMDMPRLKSRFWRRWMEWSPTV